MLFRSETAWRHNRTAVYLYGDGHAKTVPYQEGTRFGGSSGGHTVNAGLYRFPGYDWNNRDGSLWGAWNIIPGGGAPLTPTTTCRRLAVTIPGNPND